MYKKIKTYEKIKNMNFKIYGKSGMRGYGSK